MKRGRKKRLAPKFPTYCGQTTPTVRMRVIVSRRTRVSQSSHSLVAKLLSMACPRLCFGRRNPQVRAEKAEGKVSCNALREGDNAERTEARLVRAAQLADQREQRQVHGNDHAADHHAEKNDHDGFESSQQVLHCRVHFFFIEIGDLLEHGVHGARLFADGNHLRHHAREDFGISQWFRERLAFLERFSYLLQSPLDDRVSSVRVNRATAIFLIKTPRTGSLRTMVSRTKRPCFVPYQTFNPKMPAPRATRIKRPKILPMKLLNPMTIFVAKGRSTPSPANNVAKIGTTFQSSNVMTPPATVKTPTG